MEITEDQFNTKIGLYHMINFLVFENSKSNIMRIHTHTCLYIYKHSKCTRSVLKILELHRYAIYGNKLNGDAKCSPSKLTRSLLDQLKHSLFAPSSSFHDHHHSFFSSTKDHQCMRCRVLVAHDEIEDH